jgi:hypothetical protein
MSARTGRQDGGTRRASHHGGRRRPPGPVDEAAAKSGMKLAAAGLLGTAALAGPWASPTSITLTHLNPRSHSAAGLTGSGTHVRVYKYGRSVLASATRGQSRRSSAARQSMRPATQPGTQGLQPGGYPANVTLTAARPGNGAAGDTSGSAAASMPGGRFVNSRAAVVVKPDGTLIPLPVGSNTYTVPEGSLLMMSGGPTIPLRPGVYTSPYGVITVTPATAPAAAAAAGPAGPAGPAGSAVSGGLAAPGPPQATTVTLTADAAPASPAVTGPGMVFANLLGGMNPGGPFIQWPSGQQGQQQSWNTTAPTPQGTGVGVFDVNGNPVGFVARDQATGTVQLISPVGSVLGTVQSYPVAGNMTVVSPSGDVLGSLGINRVSNAVTLVAATPTPATTMTSQPTGAPATATPPTAAATGTAGTAKTAGTAGSASTTKGHPVEIFDVSGHPAGFTVIDQATGSVNLVSPGGSVLGKVQADQATGRLIVVGTNGAGLGQLGLNQATGAVTLVTGSPSQTPVATSPSPGGGADFAVGTPASAATSMPVARPISMVAADPVASLTPA